MLSSILSFGQNPLYIASIYTKMSLKNSQVVKDFEVVNALVNTILVSGALIAASLGYNDSLRTKDTQWRWCRGLNRNVLN